MSCSQLKDNRCFRGTYYLHLQQETIIKQTANRQQTDSKQAALFASFFMLSMKMEEIFSPKTPEFQKTEFFTGV
jgi:hypothetical protein